MIWWVMFRDNFFPHWFAESGYAYLPFPSADEENFFDEVNMDSHTKSITIGNNQQASWMELAKILNHSQSNQRKRKYLTDVIGLVGIKIDEHGVTIEIDPIRYRQWWEGFPKEQMEFESPEETTKTVLKRKSRDTEETVTKKIKSHLVPTLTLPQRKLNKLASEYSGVLTKPPSNFNDALTNLLPLTGTRIRKIKKNEIGYLKSNYMVNPDNIKDNLELLVKNNGRLTAGSVSQFYDVLVMENDVIGHLVFYYDKEKNEIIIPAVEVALTHRGRHFGTLFILSVLSFAQQIEPTPVIRLETGHHHNAEKLKETLTKGMVTFYCKLGYRLDRIPIEVWEAKTLPEKIGSFTVDNEKCVFDFSSSATKAAMQEAVRTTFAYQIKDILLDILEDHAKEFKKTSNYSVYDLLASTAYTGWLKTQLNKSGLFDPDHIDAALKILFYEIQSKAEIKGIKLEKADDSELLAAIEKSGSQERPGIFTKNPDPDQKRSSKGISRNTNRSTTPSRGNTHTS